MGLVMNRRILVVGSGGREHALGWKLRQSPEVEKVFHAPGNGGTADNVSLKATDIDGLIHFADEHNCFTVVGPEEPLAMGLVDRFQAHGLKAFGPSKASAQLETSKVFAKQFMDRHGVPTAEFGVFSNREEALNYVAAKGLPKVVKADGLAAGKGAIICHTLEEADDALERMLVRSEFGSAGDRIVVEDFLKGYEVSFIGICDGETVIPLATSQDHKRIFEGDQGANTGGMGAYSPVPMVSKELHDVIVEQVMKRTVEGMRKEGHPFKGILYAGIMVVGNEPYVLEFNCRFGDPETQPQLLRMKSDLLPYLEASVDGRLASLGPIEWKGGSAVCVVMSSRGYPSVYEKGRVIRGLDEVVKLSGVTVFHAGTKRRDHDVLTNGGRVLGITALGRDLREAVERAYLGVGRIRFEGAHYRGDIGYKALAHLGGV
jgi:phosphoribosylamine--glycine ligase